jgi:pimeloyl-ACP methyl ester carboxylesterase
MSDNIACLHYPAPGGEADILLIMLPGAGIGAGDFAEQGMVAAVQNLAPSVEVIVAHPDMGLYLEDGVTEVLHHAVVEPALARGRTRIWLLGISLGGMGALLYASAHRRHIEGIILLAPFLGTRGTIAELTRAGGLTNWSATTSAATEPEQRLLTWLQAQLAKPDATPALYLGYAAQDRFAPAHKLLAALLPPAHIAIAPGGHDWPSWSALWHQLLGKAPFARHAGRCEEQ